MWRNIKTVDELLQGMLSLLLPCYLSTSTSLCLRHVPSFAIFPSVSRRRRWRQRHRKHDFHSILLFPMISNANLSDLAGWISQTANGARRFSQTESAPLNQTILIFPEQREFGHKRFPGASFPKVPRTFRARKSQLTNCNPLVLKSWSFNVILM